MKDVYSLWMGDIIPPLQYKCIQSWIKMGYIYNLFIYETPRNVPDGVVLHDANILSTKKYYYDNMDYASEALHADLLRYIWLYDYGGTWVDTDVVCLKPLPNDDIIISSEAFRKEPYYNASMTVIRTPPHSELFRLSLDLFKYHIDSGNRNWGKYGPKIISQCMRKLNIFNFNHLAFIHEYTPIASWMMSYVYQPNAIPYIPQSYTIHLYNIASNRVDVDLSELQHKDSLYSKIWRFLDIAELTT